MKCIVLAGGRGDRLWPLSRKNLPKQFIQLQGDHSVFQETIARNMPYCDEFIVVTNKEYEFTAENQIRAFQGLVHRYIYEGEGRKTTAAITLACLQLPASEIVLVVPADQLIGNDGYKEDLLHAKAFSEDGKLVTFGMPIVSPEERFGYIRFRDEEVLQFTEKPDRDTAEEYQNRGDYLVNSGMFVFRVGEYLNELKKYSPDLYQSCRAAYRMRKSKPGGQEYSAEVMQSIPAVPVEKAVFEKTSNAKVVHASFEWLDIGSLEDLKSTELKTADDGQQVLHECENTDIINRCGRRVVVANGIQDAIIVNTKDVVYVGKKGRSNELKKIIEKNPQIAPFVEGCRVIYRQWGFYELLVDTPHYRVKKAVINPGRAIYSHKHIYRSEHWVIVTGEAMIELDGECRRYSAEDVIDVARGVVHQVTNVGKDPMIMIEVSMGENVSEDDKISVKTSDLTEEEMGLETEPFVKLQPAFKDYLWGGTRLKTVYHKKCDYEIVAESWELSAHEAGTSIVASGRHRGMNFAEYLSLIGKNNWGWKCRTLNAFPILIKFIDAQGALSVQVHPDDDYALPVENQYGKNEMWYVIDCEPDSFIYCGFSRDVSREEVSQRLNANTILDVLNKVPVRKGDAYFIPAGTVHAIGAGILICEIQQSSNCTYRLYDYNRKDKFGNLRELHIAKALDVLNYKKYSPQKLEDTFEEEKGFTRRVISRCKYFECIRYELSGKMDLAGVDESFSSLVCISGSGRISLSGDEEAKLDFHAGDSIFMPKTQKSFQITGECELIITRV